MAPTDENLGAHGGLPHLVSACVHCHEVIGLPAGYSTGDALVCPVCEKPLDPSEVRPRTLRVALKSDSPPRPLPESPTPESLREWLEKSSSQFGLSESVLDPTPSEHHRESESGVESSLSGIEIGSIFPQEKLEGGSSGESEESNTQEYQPSDFQTAVAQAETEPEPAPADHPAMAEAADTSLPTALEAPPTEESPHGTPPSLQLESDALLDPTPEALAPEESAAEEPEEPSVQIDSGALGEEVTAQLLQAGAERETRTSYLLPAAGLLLAICAPIGAAYYFLFASDEGVEAENVAHSAAPSAEPDPTAATRIDEYINAPEDGGAAASETGVETASFEQPALGDPEVRENTTDLLPFEEGYNAVGDRYDDQSVSDDPEGPAGQTLVEPEPGYTPGPPVLHGAPVYTYQDLFDATSEARPAGRAFVRGSMDNPSDIEAAGRHFSRLCYLAQVITLLDPNDPHDDLTMTTLEATGVFKRVLRSATHRDLATEIAGSWIEWAGRPHGGVFFVGVPSEARRVGGLYEYEFEVAGVAVVVITEAPIDVNRFINARAQEVGVIGVVVEDPSTHVPGYRGEATKAVWVRKTLALTSPDAY